MASLCLLTGSTTRTWTPQMLMRAPGMRSPSRGIFSCRELFLNFVGVGCERAWNVFYPVLALVTSPVFYFFYIKMCDIMLHVRIVLNV